MDAPIEQRESPYEILRRMENTVRLGTIAEVRHGAPARCRVRTGKLLTAWIPWLAGRAGSTDGRMWWPPVVGEQCLLLAPGGDLLQAVALLGIYSDAKPQGGNRPKDCMAEFSQGDHVSYESELASLTAEMYGAITLLVQGNKVQIDPDAITLEVGSSQIKLTKSAITLQAGGGTATLTGAGLSVTPDVSAMGVSLVNHLHTAVQTGGSLSGPPP
ncbi:MAG: phage baseplate assembly protein V [Proteobacteria bacterium]|nr:phage baseplate assembly protein V [Pseudomonadota bacterium]